jgi:hypothetical protein
MTLAKSEQSEARSVSGIIPHSRDEIRKASGSSVIIHRYRKLNINNLTFRTLRKNFHFQVTQDLRGKINLKVYQKPSIFRRINGTQYKPYRTTQSRS